MVVKKIKLLDEARDKVLRGTMQGFNGYDLGISRLGATRVASRGRRLGQGHFTRRAVVTAAVAGGGGLVSTTLVSTLIAGTGDDAVALIEQLIGKTPAVSDRLHLVMPRLFPNGYTVPMTIQIDTPMTETDYVRHIRVFAPRNPLVEVAAFHFIPNRSEPRGRHGSASLNRNLCWQWQK